MFDADRPITRSEQDRLNRSQFAKYLARCMLDHKDPESLVIGLYGGWGVGKTSILNMVLEELNFAATNIEANEKPIILNFSPWSYSGQGQLIYSFFRRLSSALRSADYLGNKDRIIYLLELYVSFFTQKPIPKPFRHKRTFLEKITFRHHHEDIYAWEAGRDLTLVKAELNELLRGQKHKIVILIDNISRLYPDEIKQMFQIIKSMGDYVNTAYLISIDKEQVIRALNKIDDDSGSAYVNKIVQLPFDVPPIMHQDIENILSDRLSEIVATVPEEAWNIEYWADIYYTSLKYFFNNCRDITRYVNTLSFSYSRMRDIVNPVDYFALTAIEVFLPDVHAGIADNKDLFTDLLDNVYKLNRDEINKDRLRCDEILARNKAIAPDVLLDLIMKLFPRIRHIYKPDEPFYHSDATARKLKRACSPDLFDVYFRLSMQPGQIPHAEFDTILELAPDQSAFDQILTRLNQDNRVLKFLDQLDGNILNDIPLSNIPSIIDGLLDNGDLFPAGSKGMLSLDTPMRIHRIIRGLLRRYKDTSDRFDMMQTAIAKATKSIYIIVHELHELSREQLAEEDTYLPLEYRDLSPEQLDSLKQLTVNRIENWAQTKRLDEHPQLFLILRAWKEWSNDDSCNIYVKQLTDTDHGLVYFLTATLSGPITQAMTKYVKNVSWGNSLQNINEFIAADSLKERAKSIFEDGYFEKLREREQLAVMIYLDLVKATTNKIIPNTTV